MQDVKKQIVAQKTAQVTSKTVTYVFLGVMAIFMFIPFYWMLITSLKGADEVRLPNPTLFPQTFVWSNYPIALEKARTT